MIAVEASPAWRERYPGASVGFLEVSDVANPAEHAGLEARKRALEADLRERLGRLERKALAQHAVLPAYAAYYKAFQKTYHVQGQLESVVLKGRALPGVAALVEAMFMAELKNLLLTAGHDALALRGPVRVDVAHGDERYTSLRGQPQTLKPGDMFMADEEGVISSVLFGPDQRTLIQPTTTHVLFAVYAPTGVGAPVVDAHLHDILELVRVVAPSAALEALTVLSG